METVTIVCRDCGKTWQRPEPANIVALVKSLPLILPAREICEACKKIREGNGA